MPEMHRIFLIDDVVRAIVLEACAGELSRTDRFLIEFTNEKLNLGENVRTVLARTCRVLSEPALDLIWSDPPPWALAQLLPTKTWKLVPDWTVTDDEATKTSVRLCRWLSSKPAVFKRPGLQRFVEWMLWDKRRSRMARMATFSHPLGAFTLESLGDRFHFYAKRVRSLQASRSHLYRTMHWPKAQGVDLSILAAWIATEGALPHLKALEFNSDALSAPSTPQLCQGLSQHGTSITSLDFVLVSWTASLLDEGRAVLLELCPRLQVLNLLPRALQVRIDVDNTWNKLFSDMVAHTQKLRQFSALEIHPEDVLQLLARNPQLEKFTITTLPILKADALHMHNIRNACESSSTCSPASTQLRRMSLIDTSPHNDTARRVLAMSSSDRLHTCNLHLHYLTDSTEWNSRVIKDTLYLMCRHTSLVNVMLSFSAFATAGLTATVPMDVVISSLQALPQLEMLDIDTSTSAPVDRAMLDALLLACPRLRRWSSKLCFSTSNDLCRLSLNEFLEILHDRPFVEELPVRVGVSQLALLVQQQTTDVYAYGPELAVDVAECSKELRVMVRTMFSKVERLLLTDGATPVAI